jgi:hypothetical protein
MPRWANHHTKQMRDRNADRLWRSAGVEFAQHSPEICLDLRQARHQSLVALFDFGSEFVNAIILQSTITNAN